MARHRAAIFNLTYLTLIFRLERPRSAVARTVFSAAAMNYGLERTLHIEEVNLAFNSNGQPTLEVRKNYGKNVYALYRTTLVAPPDNEVGMACALRDALEVQFLEKQNTAGQTQWQQGQYTTFRVTYSLPQKQPKYRKHAPPIK